MKKVLIPILATSMILCPSINVFASIDDAQNAFSELNNDGSTVQVSEIVPYDGCKILQVTETINSQSNSTTDFITSVSDKIKEIAQSNWFDYNSVYRNTCYLDAYSIDKTVSMVYDFDNDRVYYTNYGDSGCVSLYSISDGSLLKQTNTLQDVVSGNSATTESSNSDGATLAQQNALQSAIKYLNYTSFSYTGLIQQLEYEGYSEEDATYAVDNSGADWNEQAAKTAQKYLEYTSFSREQLVEQLKYEGFTDEQAEYGAQAVGY